MLPLEIFNFQVKRKVQVQAVGFIRPPYYRIKNGISFYFPPNVCFILRWWWLWNREEPSGQLVLLVFLQVTIIIHICEWVLFMCMQKYCKRRMKLNLCISMHFYTYQNSLTFSEESYIELQESLLTNKCETNCTLWATLKIII